MVNYTMSSNGRRPKAEIQGLSDSSAEEVWNTAYPAGKFCLPLTGETFTKVDFSAVKSRGVRGGKGNRRER